MAMKEIDIRITQLEQRLSMEDLDTMERVREEGWELIPQGKGFFWRKNGEESVTIFSDEGLVEFALRKLPDVAPEQQVQEDIAATSALSDAPQKYSDHEVDLKDKLIKWLESEGVTFERDVFCDFLTAEVVTEDAVYEFKCGLSPENIGETVKNLISCWKILIDDSEGMVNHGAAAIIVTCCAPDLEKVRELAEGLEVEVRTFEEVISPSPPEFVESLFLQLKEVADSSGLSRLIEENKLQDVIGDRRFTPTQQKKLEDALDACCERVTPSLESEDEQPAPALRPEILLDKIRIDGGTQPRAQLNMLTIDEYAEAMEEGAVFPPVIVFFDGSDYWLADGFHRYHAAKKIGREVIDVDVRQGTRRDAVLFSLGANATHGLPRTNEDKRRAVSMLLEDEEWSQWSDSIIAQKTSVSQPFVSKLRRETATQNGFKTSTVRKGADGVTRDTANIGGRKEESQEPSLFSEDKSETAVRKLEEDEKVSIVARHARDSEPPLRDEDGIEMPADLAAAGWRLKVRLADEAHSEPRYSCVNGNEDLSEGSYRTTGAYTNPNEAIAAARQAESNMASLQSSKDASENKEVSAPSPVTQNEQPSEAKPDNHYQAWLKATVKVSITIFPDDGDEAGRNVLVVVHEEGGIPLTEFSRDKSASDPGVRALNCLLGKLRQELPARMVTKAPAKPSTPVKTSPAKKKSASAAKSATKATKKSATKGPKKQSTKPSAGAK